MDLFDELGTRDEQPSVDDSEATNWLVVPVPVVNGKEYDAIAARTNEVYRLDLPMVFETEQGELANPQDFGELRALLGRMPTPDEAAEYLEILREPAFAKWQPIIDAARAEGPDEKVKTYSQQRAEMSVSRRHNPITHKTGVYHADRTCTEPD
jgi:hypothetical protein